MNSISKKTLIKAREKWLLLPHIKYVFSPVELLIHLDLSYRNYIGLTNKKKKYLCRKYCLD
jgi:hypothetical protein